METQSLLMPQVTGFGGETDYQQTTAWVLFYTSYCTNATLVEDLTTRKCLPLCAVLESLSLSFTETQLAAVFKVVFNVDTHTLRSLLFSLLMLIGSFAGCGFAQSECYIDVKAYNPEGLVILGTITKAFAYSAQSERSQRRSIAETAPSIKGMRVTFGTPPEPGQQVNLRIVDGKGTPFEIVFSFKGCGQRQTIVLGRREHGGGEGHSAVKGRVIGCIEYKDWWVKLMPMFGWNEQALNPEASINQKTGAFSISAFLPGVRHILVIGSGNTALSAHGVNLVEGGQITLRDVSVSDKCR